MVHEVRIVLRLELPEGMQVAGEIPPTPLVEGGRYGRDEVGEPEALPERRLHLVTKAGLKQLGKFLLSVRGERPLVELADLIEANTGHRLEPSTLSALERGNSTPKINTLQILGGSGLFCCPVGERVYEGYDLYLVACERLDPWTGEMV